MITYIYTEIVCECYSNFILNKPKLETTQMSITCEMDKQTKVHSYHGILFSNTEERTTDKITWMNLKYVMLSKDATDWMIPFV